MYVLVILGKQQHFVIWDITDALYLHSQDCSNLVGAIILVSEIEVHLLIRLHCFALSALCLLGYDPNLLSCLGDSLVRPPAR